MIPLDSTNQWLTPGRIASGAKGRWFESTRAYQLNPIPSINCDDLGKTVGQLRIDTVPRFVPTLCLFHSGAHCLHLRVNVPLRGSEVAVAGQIGQRVRVHVGRPAGQAGVTERVRDEKPHA